MKLKLRPITLALSLFLLLTPALSMDCETGCATIEQNQYNHCVGNGGGDTECAANARVTYCWCRYNCGDNPANVPGCGVVSNR